MSTWLSYGRCPVVSSTGRDVVVKVLFRSD